MDSRPSRTRCLVSAWTHPRLSKEVISHVHGACHEQPRVGSVLRGRERVDLKSGNPLRKFPEATVSVDLLASRRHKRLRRPRAIATSCRDADGTFGNDEETTFERLTSTRFQSPFVKRLSMCPLHFYSHSPPFAWPSDSRRTAEGYRWDGYQYHAPALTFHRSGDPFVPQRDPDGELQVVRAKNLDPLPSRVHHHHGPERVREEQHRGRHPVRPRPEER